MIFRKIQYGVISWFCHDLIVIIYNFIDIWTLIDMCPLPLCYSDDSQKCELKIMNTEETQRKKTMKKTLIWKHDIGFLNFRRNITFTILATFQNFIIITLSTPRPWTTHDVRFFKRWLVIAIFKSVPVVFRCCE